MKISKNILLSLAILFPVVARATIKLPSMLADNMVLQQQSRIRLWGTAKAGTRVTLFTSWDKRTYSTKSDPEGRWEVAVRTSAAGGPYTIRISDGTPLILQNIMLGEVWFCSGQSNMEMPMRGFDRQPLKGGNDLIIRAKASTPIRMFVSDSMDGKWIRQWSRTPQETCEGQWLTNTSGNVAVTSAVAYYFARYIQDVLEVPVGIIISTLGGSKIEAWMSREALAPFHKDLSVLDGTGDVNIHSAPCGLFNAKVNPFTGMTVRGFLWYQGESNIGNAAEYADLQTAMVRDWRKRWGDDNLPFYFVEIAPYRYEGVDKTSSAYLREAQQKAYHQIPNSGIVTTLDIGSPVFIHPVEKAQVGRRLAWWALGQTYGRKGFEYKPPMYQSMEIKDGKIYINAENMGNGLCPMWTSLKGFEIAGEDRHFYPAFAEIEERTCRLAVSNVKVPHPVAVRYAWRNCPEASVFNIQGLPLMPFRTDQW
ncbi:MAG: sialate O-acetylesterase [Prevotella sp.]|nr:sialate O-acetylesterase [Prevotella sp.]MDY4038968.1 sialate O-acetylesterase [Prevotella sp.]